MNYLLGGPSFRPHPHRLSSAWKPTVIVARSPVWVKNSLSDLSPSAAARVADPIRTGTAINAATVARAILLTHSDMRAATQRGLARATNSFT